MPVKMRPTSFIISKLGLQSNGPAERFFTSTCAKHIDKYVPYDEGNLASYHIEGNYIVYEQHYAHYQYEGISKNGNPLNYSKDKHPLANNHWDERMVTAEMKDVEKEVQEFIDKGGK